MGIGAAVGHVGVVPRRGVTAPAVDVEGGRRTRGALFKALHVRQGGQGTAVGGEAVDGAPGALVGRTAKGAHIYVVGAAGTQAAQLQGGAVGGLQGHLIDGFHSAIGHLVAAGRAVPGEGGRGAGDVAGRDVGRTDAVGLEYVHVVHAGGRLGALAVVVAPVEDHLVDARRGDIGLGGVGLPGIRLVLSQVAV